MTDYIIVGQITRAQGIRGQLRVRAITPDPARFFDLNTLFTEHDGAYTAHALDVSRVEGDYVYIHFDDVPDRSAAEALQGTLVYVDRAHAIKLPANATFVCDLIGCEGVTDGGVSIGHIVEVLQSGGTDVYVFEKNGRRVMVPALISVMPEVDIANKNIRIDIDNFNKVSVVEN